MAIPARRLVGWLIPVLALLVGSALAAAEAPPASKPPAASAAPAAEAPKAEAPTAEERVERGRKLLGENAKQAAALLEQAVAELQESLRKNPQDAKGSLVLGKAFFYLERDKEAMAALDQALKADPKVADAHYWKGVLLRFQKAPDEAVRELTAAADLAPTQARYWLEIGEVRRNQDRPQDAAPLYRKALACDPKCADAAFHLGVILADAGKSEEAATLFRQSVEADPDNPVARYNLAQTYQNRGQSKEALAQFQEVVKRRPDDWKARTKLVQLHEALGDTGARDKERAALFDLRKKKTVPELAQAKFYCRDQFTAAGRKLMVFEYFELEGNDVTKYAFDVLDASGRNVETKIMFGYHEVLDEIELEQEQLKAGEHRWHLDANTPDAHVTFEFYKAEPPYEEVKKRAIAFLPRVAKPGPAAAPR
jgi:cytochrome c-type biogenesis protein CcmH/NrfG